MISLRFIVHLLWGEKGDFIISSPGTGESGKVSVHKLEESLEQPTDLSPVNAEWGAETQEQRELLNASLGRPETGGLLQRVLLLVAWFWAGESDGEETLHFREETTAAKSKPAIPSHLNGKPALGATGTDGAGEASPAGRGKPADGVGPRAIGGLSERIESEAIHRVPEPTVSRCRVDSLKDLAWGAATGALGDPDPVAPDPLDAGHQRVAT